MLTFRAEKVKQNKGFQSLVKWGWGYMTCPTLHYSESASEKAKKKRFPTDAQPNTEIPGEMSSGIIVKQDKARSVAGQITPDGNADRRRKNEISQGLREITEVADRYEKSVCHTLVSGLFGQKRPKSLREFSKNSCLKIAHKQFYRKNEVYPI